MFKYWTSEIMCIQIETRNCRLALADCGFVGEDYFDTYDYDTPPVFNLKQKLSALKSREEQILLKISEAGAKIIDFRTLEIILPGGPVEDSYLSWIPGEIVIGYYRHSDCPKDKRHTIPGIDPKSVNPVHH